MPDDYLSPYLQTVAVTVGGHGEKQDRRKQSQIWDKSHFWNPIFGTFQGGGSFQWAVITDSRSPTAHYE